LCQFDHIDFENEDEECGNYKTSLWENEFEEYKEQLINELT